MVVGSGKRFVNRTTMLAADGGVEERDRNRSALCPHLDGAAFCGRSSSRGFYRTASVPSNGSSSDAVANDRHSGVGPGTTLSGLADPQPRRVTPSATEGRDALTPAFPTFRSNTRNRMSPSCSEGDTCMSLLCR